MNIRPHIPKLAKQKLDDRVNSTLKLRKDYLENQAQEDFICGVCTFIVEEPSCCNECDANYCKTCIDGLDTCPKCQANIKGITEKRYNRILAKYLNDLKFLCPVCKKTFAYADRMEHLNEIKLSLQPLCPLECKHPFTSVEDLMIHLEEECPSAIFTCEHCSASDITSKLGQKSHKCEGSKFTEHLLKIIENQKSIISKANAVSTETQQKDARDKQVL